MNFQTNHCLRSFLTWTASLCISNIRYKKKHQFLSFEFYTIKFCICCGVKSFSLHRTVNQFDLDRKAMKDSTISITNTFNNRLICSSWKLFFDHLILFYSAIRSVLYLIPMIPQQIRSNLSLHLILGEFMEVNKHGLIYIFVNWIFSLSALLSCRSHFFRIKSVLLIFEKWEKKNIQQSKTMCVTLSNERLNIRSESPFRRVLNSFH